MLCSKCYILFVCSYGIVGGEHHVQLCFVVSVIYCLCVLMVYVKWRTPCTAVLCSKCYILFVCSYGIVGGEHHVQLCFVVSVIYCLCVLMVL